MAVLVLARDAVSLGTYGEVLHEWRLRTVRGDTTSSPPSLYGIDAVVVMGERSQKFLEQLLDQGIPLFAVGSGVHAILGAMGEDRERFAGTSIGFRTSRGDPHTISLTVAGKAHPLCAGLPDTFHTFHLREDEVSPYDGAKVLAEGNPHGCQILQLASRAFGIVSHLELSKPLLARLLEEVPDLKDPVVRGAVKTEAPHALELFRLNAKTLFENFLSLAGLTPRRQRLILRIPIPRRRPKS